MIMLESPGGKMKNYKKYYTVTSIVMALIFVLCSCSGASDAAEEKKNNETAKEAYDLIKEAESICEYGMDDIYQAWYFGLEYASTCSTSVVFNELAKLTSFSAEELENDGENTAKQLVYGDGSIPCSTFCIWTITTCLEKRGDFEKIDSLLSKARENILSLPNEYAWLEDLIDYCSLVYSYDGLFDKANMSFNEFRSYISEYGKDIIEAKKGLMLFFEYVYNSNDE